MTNDIIFAQKRERPHPPFSFHFQSNSLTLPAKLPHHRIHRLNLRGAVRVAAAEQKRLVLIASGRVDQGLRDAVRDRRRVALLKAFIALVDERVLYTIETKIRSWKGTVQYIPKA